MVSASSLTTALAIAVPSKVAVPLPVKVKCTKRCTPHDGVPGAAWALQKEGNRNCFLPNSSTSTKECTVACLSMLAVSLSSTKNVLSPKIGNRTINNRLYLV